jgi:hypothetical protein
MAPFYAAMTRLVAAAALTDADFYPEYCDLDIDPNEFEGTTRERFIHILSNASPGEQTAIVDGVLARFPVDSEPQRTAQLAEQLRVIANRCRSEGQIASPKLSELSHPFARRWQTRKRYWSNVVVG